MKIYCPYCISEKVTVALTLDDSTELLKCSNCGFLWKNIVLKNDYYNKLDYDYYNTHNDKLVVDRRIKYISELLGNEHIESILDFGGGDGFLLSNLPMNCKKTLVELSESGREIANSKYTINAFAKIENIPFNENFDMITMFDVLEHISDFTEILKKLKSKLNSSGFFIIETGITDALWARIAGNKWKYYYYSEHSYFFKKKLIDDFFIDGYDKIHSSVISHSTKLTPKLIYIAAKVFLYKINIGKKNWGSILLPLYHDHYKVIFRKN